MPTLFPNWFNSYLNTLGDVPADDLQLFEVLLLLECHAVGVQHPDVGDLTKATRTFEVVIELNVFSRVFIPRNFDINLLKALIN